jgi:hygromycin-B 7''-O-kinase
MLPETDHGHFMANLHRGPVDLWRPALDVIAHRHGVAVQTASRVVSGRNVVLETDALVVKLVPPFWRHMWSNERDALGHVFGRLSVATPRLRFAGTIDGWGYLVMERVPGISLGWRGEGGSTADRHRLARLQGRLVREIALIEPKDSISWDWIAVLGEDRAALADDLIDVPDRLAATAADYVDAAGDLATGETFLHGDLSSINLLFTAAGDVALVDWSDASAGPADHEFISPFMHQFRGDRADLEAFWDGYGPVDDPTATAHRVMARSILKYASLMGRYLSDLPGPMPASWSEAAARFTLIHR